MNFPVCYNCVCRKSAPNPFCDGCDSGSKHRIAEWFVIKQLQAEVKDLKDRQNESKVKRGQYREIIEGLLVPTNFISIEAARDYILEALECYGLAEVSKP